MRLCDAPVGLFLFGDTLCLMTEYSSEGCGRHAYIVSSGEMFWGGAKSKEERASLEVVPVTVSPGGLSPQGSWDLDDKRRPYCTNCKKVAIQFENKAYYVPGFCYHCGADMQGGGEDG